MTLTETTRLADMAACPIRPMSQTDAKSVLADLKEIGRGDPAVAAMLSNEGPLRDFVIAAFSLSPFLRDTANVTPSLLATAVVEPL